jgi:uncharacterized membrane protein (UPF0127 family)
MKSVRIINQTHPADDPIVAKFCQSFFCQLRGLMFTSDLPERSGLLLVQSSNSRMNASIHMMFMRMDLAVFWINSEFTVVERIIAERWKLGYIPKSPAKYVLETGVTNLNEFNIGDKVIFEETAQS